MVVAKKGRTKTTSKALQKAWWGTAKIARNRTGFPQRMRMNHRYATNIFRSAAAGAISTFVFSANGMFDPDITGTGHQPTYFDKMAALYDHYTVLSSKVSVVAVSISTSTAKAAEIVLNLGDTASSSFSNTNNCREQPYCSYIQMPLCTATNPASTINNRLSLAFNAYRTFGSRALSDPNLRGDSSSNPTEGTFYYLSCQDVNIGAQVDINYMITIDYQAEWTEQRQENTN